MIQFNLSQRDKKLPEMQSGDVVKVHRKIKEGEKERIQIFEGIIIAVKGRQSSSPTITVRKVSNGVGVEIIVPVYSPQIEKIEMVKRAKVRRAKLYYIREKTAKALRLKYKDLSEFGKIEEKKEASVENKEASDDSVNVPEKAEAKSKAEDRTEDKEEKKNLEHEEFD